MKPYMINQNDLFEEAQNFVKRVERLKYGMAKSLK